MKIVAWIGAGFMFLSAALWIHITFFYHFQQHPLTPVMDISYLTPMPSAILAVLLILLGGFFGKPKYFWPITILGGIIFFLVFYPLIRNDINSLRHYGSRYVHYDTFIKSVIFCCLPAILLFIEGIYLFKKNNKKSDGSK
jgi:NADH:ubiquinone oxidoreductase subunit 5 (subunit L)/multisubunit Na+/H+ antiporter MnhA subunit